MSALGVMLMCLGATFLLVGFVISVASSPNGTSTTGLREAPMAAVPPAAVRRQAGAAFAGRSTTSTRDQFYNARLGQNITFNHPQRGPVVGKILGVIQYTELWQRVNSPSEPWVPTGNSFAAHWLGSFMLYEWQNRLYVLDEYVPLSDQDIQTSFLPYARRFAQSDQTATVTFAWPPASWTIADIGKFRVARAEGTGLRLNAGAEGRFIHATGADQRALIVEDYQSGGGGQDTAWLGWQIAWDDVTGVT
jgi:hypothetical protein